MKTRTNSGNQSLTRGLMILEVIYILETKLGCT